MFNKNSAKDYRDYLSKWNKDKLTCVIRGHHDDVRKLLNIFFGYNEMVFSFLIFVVNPIINLMSKFHYKYERIKYYLQYMRLPKITHVVIILKF